MVIRAVVISRRKGRTAVAASSEGVGSAGLQLLSLQPAAVATVTQIFTDYVRSLDPSGEPPDPGSFDRAWSALGKALTRELKRRGLWDTSPHYLGVYGALDWHANPSAEAGGLEELLVDCYSHVFVRRLGGLKAQLALKPSIDGLVLVAIRNFLHDLQKKHDPLGFRVFEVLRSAVRGALEDGEMVRISGDRRIRNDTVLGYTEWVDGGPPPTLGDSEQLASVVETWNDVLLPDLITARGAARKRVIEVLRSLLVRLPAEGIEAVTFKQLIDPLKNDARARWSALHESTREEPAIEIDDGGLLSMVRQIPPDSGVEERDSFDKLAACVTEAVDRWQEPGRLRIYLSTLWEFLRTQPGEEATDGRAATAAPDGPLSARQLASLLRIPRDRIPSLMTTLKRLVEACRAATPEKRPVNLSREVDDP